MSENNNTFLENETHFWDEKRDDHPESDVVEYCDANCNGNCNCKKAMTYCGIKCDKKRGQCLNCEIDDIWMNMIRGKSSKESIDLWINMKMHLISCMKDQESDTVNKLKKDVQALHLLRDRQKE